jgi:hypothetical protein
MMSQDYLMIKLPILMLLLLVSCADFGNNSEIVIKNDEFACTDKGLMAMAVDVYIDKQHFHFDLSCNFRAQEVFYTSNGHECLIESGMCTGEVPREQIHVSCNNFSSNYIEVFCPKKPKLKKKASSSG